MHKNRIAFSANREINTGPAKYARLENGGRHIITANLTNKGDCIERLEARALTVKEKEDWGKMQPSFLPCGDGAKSRKEEIATKRKNRWKLRQ